MSLDLYVVNAAGLAAAGLALAALVRRRRSVASWCFFLGFLLFALEAGCQARFLRLVDADDRLSWHRLEAILEALRPGVFLIFSLCYSRGNYREYLRRWRLWLALAFLLPLGVACGFSEQLFSLSVDPAAAAASLEYRPAGKLLNLLLLIIIVAVLGNLEKTLHSAVGTMRWRMKFLLLGLGLILGVELYLRCQAQLFSREDLRLIAIQSAALLIGSFLIGMGHLRRGLAEVDVYPSPVIVHRSLVIIVVGAYLFAIGIVAQVVKGFGGSSTFQLQALVVLAGVALLSVLIFSERVRMRLRDFTTRHFQKPDHNFREVWSLLTAIAARPHTPRDLCAEVAPFLSDTFHALSVSIWMWDPRTDHLKLAGTTSAHASARESPSDLRLDRDDVAELAEQTEALNLETATGGWAEILRGASATQFQKGGDRRAVPLAAGSALLGLIVLGDRVNRAAYTAEEFDLLKCIADQLAASLLNLRLAEEIASTRELETFQTMAAFFVHDLKNSASSLNLMLRNLPQHFDKPEFREDALRGLGSAADRINDLIQRLASFRKRPELKKSLLDLNALVREAVRELDDTRRPLVTAKLEADLPIMGEREALLSVITNLIFNAADAISDGGRITVETRRQADRAILSVADDGCGMTAEFVRDRLFRPFQTTKQKGIGIGMFQTRTIVEEHAGRIWVESEPGRGSKFITEFPCETN